MIPVFILFWFEKRSPGKKKYYDTQGVGKVLENFMEHLKEINNRGNIYEQKLYDSNGNEELLHLMQIQKSLIYFVSAPVQQRTSNDENAAYNFFCNE